MSFGFDVPFSSVLEPLEARNLFAATFLVNFDAGGAVTPVSANNFAIADQFVDLTAPVNEIDSGGAANLNGSDGSTFNVLDSGPENDFTTNKGNYENQAILDSYLFINNGSRTIRVSGLDEIATGENVRVTLHGVGDAPNQDTRFTVRYDGSQIGTADTDYDSGDLADTYVVFSFVKLVGVDQFDIVFQNNGSGSATGALGGFSVTSRLVTPEAVRINAGGDTHTDSDGNVFLSDRFFDAGQTFETTEDIFIPGTGSDSSNDEDLDDILYQTERHGSDFNYQIPVANGLYTVRLHYAEIFFDNVGRRIFDVEAEGQLLSDDLDVFEARRNAFTPGNFAALVQEFNLVEVTDDFLSLNFESLGSDGVNNAKVSAIEVIPVKEAALAILLTDGSTEVSEDGATDTYRLVLTQAPTADVTVMLNAGADIFATQTVFTFTPDNYDVPQAVTVAAIDDTDTEGTQTLSINHVLTSEDDRFDGTASSTSVVVLDNDVLIQVDFTMRRVAGVDRPITGAFGPDGRLYVATQSGVIQAYTLDSNNNVVATQTINAIANQSSFNNILGIAFDPFEQVAPGENPTIYVSRSALFVGTNAYGSRVSTLSGSNFNVVEDIITGLPVSGFDHGVNGMQFDGNGDLLIAIGGNTNTGRFDGVFGSQAPESPLTSAVLIARITDPNFNGNIQYEFIDPSDPNIPVFSAGPNDQRNGEHVRVVDVPGEVEVETYAVGLRNSFDLVYTTEGKVFATDNGPNGIAEDELNLVSEGDFLGHPSIPRGKLDPRQTLANAEYDPNAPSDADYTAPLTALDSSTNGIDEYRAETFGGQLRGQLFAQKFNGLVYFFDLGDDGLSLDNVNTRTDVADGLDILAGPGGVIFGIDRNQNRITVAEPVDNAVTAPTPYDIFPYRAPAVGGNQFVIGGVNFGALEDTTVWIGGVQAVLTSVDSSRIVGVFPPIGGTEGFLDVTITTAGTTGVLEGAFLPLGEGPELESAVEARFTFYNKSVFDGNDGAANALDDAAIATDKVALLPGETADFSNYTSYSLGLNGVMVDILNLADIDSLSAADFVLSVGNGDQPEDFTLLGTLPSVSVRAGEGVNGSDRVTLTLPDGLVVGQWLRIEVLATSATGLSQSDVFYFGNAVGEAGNSASDATVNTIDVLLTRLNPHNNTDPAGIDDAFDFNRDGLVNSIDALLSRLNATNNTDDLNLISAPSEMPAEAQSIQSSFVATLVEPVALVAEIKPVFFQETASLADGYSLSQPVEHAEPVPEVIGSFGDPSSSQSVEPVEHYESGDGLYTLVGSGVGAVSVVDPVFVFRLSSSGSVQLGEDEDVFGLNQLLDLTL